MALIVWLGLLSAVLIAAVALVVALTGIAPPGEGGARPGFLHLAWMSLMRTLDPGIMSGDTGNWSFLLMMFAVSLGGVFIVSSLIGILTSGLEAKIEDLRKGRSRVLESGHTVILGWSNHVFPILAGLALANENQKNPCVAILADKDKVEMEDEIRSKIGRSKMGKTRVICRSGSPMDLTDLEIPSPQEARSIIVLGPEAGDSDRHVLKTILALFNHPNRKGKIYHVVAEFQDPKNLEVARIIGGDEVQILLSSEVISRIMVQTCLQSGLSLVYQELFDFGGDEIYFQEEPRLTGKTYGDVVLAYENAAVMGLRNPSGLVLLNPPFETVIQPGDRIIVIAEDDDTARPSSEKPMSPDPSAFSRTTEEGRQPTKVLVLGWNHCGPAVIGGLDDYVPAASEITLVCPDDVWNAVGAEVHKELTNATLVRRHAPTTDRSTLDALRIPEFEHIITLSYYDTMEAEEADAATLVTLLHLRDIARKISQRFTIVSEMIDVRNRDLAQVTKADDFIVSDRLIALLMTQLSENKDLKAVFDNLFDPAGSEIYLKPAGRYVQPGCPVDFYTVVESAKRWKETAIGYRLVSWSNDASTSFGVKINPKKSETVTFAAEDKVIVLSEEDGN